ncbi:TetR/AcrR family transcriptional regulator [Bacillus salacetis]|uniref:TetR/AcrR family transcriptional regulator n=1 Tax=Bacillus salacetis TaxID=2315464 RepID=A0A3A1QNQ1_9BACI|nr:TetR/AcrR family transcriptional regulator [Bacillus salacetis]RIW28663.1 TetR/AcrR family transcriptional regulator [Bacillus salacetis]
MSINNDYIDRRVVKSKRAMKDALISLMETKDFKTISVSDIVRSADLNRGTFYKHYQYKEDILKEIIEEITEDLFESYRTPYKGKNILELNELTSSAIKIFDHVSKYATFYTLIFQTETLSDFQHKFCAIIKDLAINDLHDQISNPKINRELQASYQAYAIFGLINEWINGGFKYSPTFMAEQLLEIVKNDRSVVIKGSEDSSS